MAFLFLGSAILLISCQTKVSHDQTDMESLITQQSDTLTLINSENGHISYLFYTPLMEHYEMARDPYMEFRHGIEITTYKDTTGIVESHLKANYAIYWDKQDLWEAKGNVVAVNATGQVLETQQLFWNRRTQKVYSNVDTRISQRGDTIIGIGFESDENFNDFTFRRPRGRVSVDATPTTARPDSTGVSAPPGSGLPAQPAPAPMVKPSEPEANRRYQGYRNNPATGPLRR